MKKDNTIQKYHEIMLAFAASSMIGVSSPRAKPGAQTRRGQGR
jgi:hypothetical protein